MGRSQHDFSSKVYVDPKLYALRDVKAITVGVFLLGKAAQRVHSCLRQLDPSFTKTLSSYRMIKEIKKTSLHGKEGNGKKHLDRLIPGGCAEDMDLTPLIEVSRSPEYDL